MFLDVMMISDGVVMLCKDIIYRRNKFEHPNHRTFLSDRIGGTLPCFSLV